MAYTSNIVNCILKLFPDAKNEIDFVVEHPFEGIRIREWNLKDADGVAIPEPTEEEINAVDAEVQEEYDGQKYARKRRAEYPRFDLQFEKIYDDGLTKWKSEMVDPVKTKWPKDNSGPVE